MVEIGSRYRKKIWYRGDMCVMRVACGLCEAPSIFDGTDLAIRLSERGCEEDLIRIASISMYAETDSSDNVQTTFSHLTSRPFKGQVAVFGSSVSRGFYRHGGWWFHQARASSSLFQVTAKLT